jgi:mRNA interferase MazF
MSIFEAWDVVKIPFPYTDRPALVVAVDESEARPGLLWLVMITSAASRGWPGDVAISDTAEAGLPVPSIVRPAKIATIEARDAEPLGKLPLADRIEVRAYLRRLSDLD